MGLELDARLAAPLAVIVTMVMVMVMVMVVGQGNVERKASRQQADGPQGVGLAGGVDRGAARGWDLG